MRKGAEMTIEININMDKKCVHCGKKGAMGNGICLKCLSKAVTRGEYDHILKPKKP